MKDKILFHGSRGGIDGNIKPISRVRCDFGKGFYMGEDSNQAKFKSYKVWEPICC